MYKFCHQDLDFLSSINYYLYVKCKFFTSNNGLLCKFFTLWHNIIIGGLIMLTKVILENFKSFKHKRIFDLESSKYQILQDSNVKDGILKGALIVGPNATGKSTLIIAIRTLLDMLFRDNFSIKPFDSCLFCNKNNIFSKLFCFFS